MHIFVLLLRFNFGCNSYRTNCHIRIKGLCNCMRNKSAFWWRTPAAGAVKLCTGNMSLWVDLGPELVPPDSQGSLREWDWEAMGMKGKA